MHRRTVLLLSICLCAARLSVQAQEFELFERQVQIHGFASQGFVYTNSNNWLTMKTSAGSVAFTDFGANVSMQVTDRLRIGAQVYDRHLGNLGEWHPSLDWVFADYRFKSWFGIRGGKVKTVIGLYNDTQDLDFLHPFALLPQSVYPTDLRDSTIAHTGGDVYGNIPLGKRLGLLSYTSYAGQRQDSQYGGYPYLLKGPPALITFSSYGGLQYGGDLRWTTPFKGLLVGMSRMNEDIDGYGTTTQFGLARPYHEWSKADWTNQYYGQYTRDKLQIESEYRRYWRDQQIYNGIFRIQTDVRGMYVAGSYRFAKRFQLGSYYSRYLMTMPLFTLPNPDPGFLRKGHIYDKVVTARFDLNRFANIKVEGHFMDGYGTPEGYPDGFYSVDNPEGLEPGTNALVVRTGFNF
jgi:hypothetical protein